MIANAIDKVGADGVLSIESSSSFETTVEVEEGMEVSSKFLLQVSFCFVQFCLIVVNFSRLTGVSFLLNLSPTKRSSWLNLRMPAFL